MQQSDYILREIEKISVLLLGIMGKLRKQEEKEMTFREEDYNDACDEILDQADFDLDKLFCVPPNRFEAFFRTTHGFDDRNIEVLADILLSMGKLSQPPRKKMMLSKALEVYMYLDKHGKIYSMERALKITEAKELLELS